MKTLEQELKIALTANEYREIASLSQADPILQINYYFCCGFPSQDTMVRIREKNGAFLLCCKNRISEKNGIFVCDERECELEENFAKSLIGRGIAFKEINSMLKTDFSKDMRCVGKMETYRSAFDWEKWHLELDKNFYLDLCDFELECECENVELLEQLKQRLQQKFALEIRFSTPKSARFFDALKGQI